VRLDVPTRHAELSAAADDAHLADVAEHLVAAEDGERAALVLPGREHEVHHHEEAERLLVRERVGALGAAHLGARGARGARRQRVVDGHHRAEAGGRGVGRRPLRDADGRRARPRHDVVEEHLEGRESAVVGRRGAGRERGGAQQQEEERGGGASHGDGWWSLEADEEEERVAAGYVTDNGEEGVGVVGKEQRFGGRSTGIWYGGGGSGIWSGR
jgi:hypothetical protein